MFSRTPCVITDVKIKKIRPDFSSQQIHSSNGAISFSHETSPEEFGFEATSCHCIMHPTVHHFTRNMHAHIRERKISCSFFFFFYQEQKLSSPRRPIWWRTIYISCLQSTEKLEKNIFLTINNLGKKERHSLTRKLARALVAHAHLYRILHKYF